MQSIDNTQKYTRLRCLPLRPVRPAVALPAWGLRWRWKAHDAGNAASLGL